MHILRRVFRHWPALCLLLLLGSTATAARSGLEAGVAAYKRGDYERALSVFRPLARQGVPRAQAILGLMYSYGEGVPVDHSLAARWYREAAEQNYVVAQYNLGMLYVEGKGVPGDRGEAVKWLERAAAGGHFRARSALRQLDRVAHDRLPKNSNAELAAPPTAMSEETATDTMDRMAAGGSSDSPDSDTKLPPSVVMNSSPVLEPPPQASTATVDDGDASENDGATRTVPRVNGAYRVQLAASRSQELIERDWSAVRAAHADLLGGLESSIERAEIGEEKTVWYRLRVGPFETKSQAEGLCDRLDERGVDVGCLPLRTKP